eukprot:Skav229281  [mRNA]  locus=scaffold952:380371:386639:- [translate_table: standard]
MTEDGRFEILEASVRVPPGDMSRATVRQLRHGLEITVPRKVHHVPHHVPHGMPHQQASPVDFQAEFERKSSSPSSPSSPSFFQEKGEVHSKETMDEPPTVTESTESTTEPTVSPKASKESKVSLPPSDGIQVLEEEYEFPEKDPDASEGWIDVKKLSGKKDLCDKDENGDSMATGVMLQDFHTPSHVHGFGKSKSFLREVSE